MNEHESGPLDDSPEALKTAAMIVRNRRLMRREYSKRYSSDDAHPLPAPNKDNAMFACKYCNKPSNHRYYAAYIGEYGESSCADCYKAGKCVPGNGRPLPGFEPVLEQSGFAPRDPDAEQVEFLAKRDPVKDAYWHGFIHGFCVAIGVVLVATGCLLMWGLP